MHVLAISQYFPPDLGGGSRRAANTLRGLKRRGHKITVITAFPHYPLGNVPAAYKGKALVHESFDEMNIIRVWTPSIAHGGFLSRLFLYLVFSFSALMALPFASKIDIIWAANTNIFSSIPGVIFSIFKRKPLVRNVDDLWPETAVEEGFMKSGFLLRFGKALARFAYLLCNGITPISQSYVNHISNKYGISKQKFRVIEHGVDTDIFRPLPANKLLIDPRCNRKFVVMYSGILGPGYNFNLLINAAEILSDDNNILIVIRGFGERDGELRDLIRKKRLENVLVLTNFLELEELVQVLSSADLLLLPMMPLKAHEAGIPTKLFEYMAVRKPIIVSSAGEPAELVKRIGAGIVSNNDPSDLARIIKELQADQRMQKNLARNGYNYVQNFLSLEKIGSRMEEFFNLIIKSA